MPSEDKFWLIIVTMLCSTVFAIVFLVFYYNNKNTLSMIEHGFIQKQIYTRTPDGIMWVKASTPNINEQ